MMRFLSVHDSPKTGTDAVRAAFLEGMAGGAGFGQLLPLLHVRGSNQGQNGFRPGRFGGSRSVSGGSLNGFDGIGFLVQRIDMHELICDKSTQHRHNPGNQNSGENLVEFHDEPLKNGESPKRTMKTPAQDLRRDPIPCFYSAKARARQEDQMSQEPKNRISFQGAPGAYSHRACLAVYPDLDPLPCLSFDDAFAAAMDGRAELAMIPVENSLAGRVADVHRLLPGSGLNIIAEHFEPVHHALLGVRGVSLDSVRHVHSHIHALPQCRRIIAELGLTPHVHADTAGAAEMIAENADPAHAAIASPLAAQIYGLDILRENIEDDPTNATRFVVLSRTAARPDFCEGPVFLTSLLFRVRNIPAALYKALGGFATNGINLTRLESYVDETFQAAQFFCDVEGHPDTPRFALALDELRFFADSVSVIGTYPAHSYRTHFAHPSSPSLQKGNHPV